MDKNPTLLTKLSSGSATSRLYYDRKIVGATTAFVQGEQVFASEYGLDPNCPFFYIFTNQGQVDAVTAYRTHFDFWNGGTKASECDIYWGDGDLLDNIAYVPAAVILPITVPGGAFLLNNDPVAASCGFVFPGQSSLGVITRWSSLADRVTIKTFAIAPASAGTVAANTLIHGIMQQPWA